MTAWLFRALAVFSTIAIALVHASPLSSPVRRQALAQVISSCTVPNTIALTFDDGPYIYLRNVSDALASVHAQATFFLNGNNWNCIYSAANVAGIKYAYAQGHQIASHTWRHARLTELDVPTITSEMARVDEALMRILGVTPAFMRPPYGAYNDDVRRVAASRNQTLVIWDYDSGDSSGVPPDQRIQGYTDLANRHPTNVLTLNHEISDSTAFQVLPNAIRLLQARGYRLVTVAECLGMAPYQRVTTPQNGTWTC